MNPFSRIAGYLVLLLCFLGLALSAQIWLQWQTQRLNTEAIEAKRQQFKKIADLLKDRSMPAEARLREAADLVGGSLRIASDSDSAGANNAGALYFDERVGGNDANPLVARVSFNVPSTTRLLKIYQRVTIGLALVGSVLFVAALLLAGFTRRSGDDRQSRAPWAKEKAQAIGFEHFARVSVERKAELERETDARRRVEEDLQTNRSLLTLSQEERAQLGRELHDNICQTLYAVCLTLDSVRQKISTTPTNQERFDQCLGELRRLNSEVRAYLRDLEPDEIQRHSFAEAVAQMVSLLPVETGVQIVRQLDEETIALIPTRDTAAIINILREAVSNALRHGKARTIMLRAQHSENMVALAVQDDGAGFVATERQNPDTGHGLANMRARAIALGGELRIESTPGKGTRVLLTVPVASAV